MRRNMKKFVKQTISMTMAVMMVFSMTPSNFVLANTEETAIKEKYRTAVSDEEYPNGVLDIGVTQIVATEGAEKQSITVIRQGNTDKEASVKFKAVDISASYGEDYLLTVKHSVVKKEKLESDESQNLMQLNAEAPTEETGTVYVEQTVSANDASEKEVSKEEDTTFTKKKKGISAAYAVQNNQNAPEYDWKEVNPEDTSDEVKALMQQGNDDTIDFVRMVDGVVSELTFKPGEYKKEIELEIIDDDKAESDEQVAFFIYDAEGTVVGPNYNGYINIKDNEEAEDNVFGVKDTNIVVEPNQDVAEVTIVRTKGVDQIAFVTVGTKAIDAVAGVDYEATNQELIFPAGVTEQTVEVPITADRTKECSFYVGISDDGVVREESKAASLITIKKGEVEDDAEAVEENTKAGDSKASVTAAAAKQSSVPITNKSQIGDSWTRVTNGFDLRFADKVEIKVTVQGSTTKKKCKKKKTFYDKGFDVKLSTTNGATTFSSQNGSVDGVESQSKTITFSRNIEDKSSYNKWLNGSSASIWVKAYGRNDNSNASIKVESVKISYPGFTVQINNDAKYAYYTEKLYTGQSKTENKNQLLLGKAKIKNSESYVAYTTENLSLGITYGTDKNSQGVKINGNNVEFKGYRLQKPNTSPAQYSGLISGKVIQFDADFVSKYYDYMYNGRRFYLAPVFEVKKATVSFAADKSMGNFKNFTIGKNLTVTKLDTIKIQAAANKGKAIKRIELKGNSYTASNVNSNDDKSSFICGFGDKGDTTYKASIYFDDASITVKADPKRNPNTAPADSTVVYTDPAGKVYQGNLNKEMVIDDVTIGKTYNILGITKEGYTPAWRDGTLDYDGDGEVSEYSNSSYASFTPVKGSVLPYVAKVPTGKVYFDFLPQQEVVNPTDIYGHITIKDRLILTGEEFEKGVNAANVSADGVQVQTHTNTTKRGSKDGYFRISSKTFDPNNYYLINVNAYGEEGSINTAFVMNPGAIKECIIDTKDDLEISEAAVYVKEGDEYKQQKITVDASGYYSDLTNGKKDYRIELRADKENVSIASAELQFYDADDKKLDKTVAGVKQNETDDGRFQFDFNPNSLGLPAGTTLRVTFTDNQGHTYLQRELGLALTQSVGNLDLINSFTFGGANTAVKMIGTIDSAFNMGWNGDFDETAGEYVTTGANSDKIIAVGFNKEVVNKSDNASNIQKAANEMASKDEEIADLQKEIAKLGKKKTLTEAESKKKKELEEKAVQAYADQKKAKENYDKVAEDAQNPNKTHTSLSTSSNLELYFSFMMTFGKDAEKNQFYFKSMILTAGVKGGTSISVSFATPIGITINLGFAAGVTDASASFIVEERNDQLHPKKYYITDLKSPDSEHIDIFDCNMNDADRKFDGYGSFHLQPYIELSVGAGVLGNMINVEISGKAEFDMQFFTLAGKNSGSVTLSSDLSVEVFCFTHKWTYASIDINLFGNSKAAELPFQDENFLYDSADILEVQNFDYMKGGTKWKSGNISAKSIDENEGGFAEVSIADKIAENPSFKMANLGNNEYLAVFTNVDPGRTAVNAKAAYYTVYKNGTWSEPVMLENDGTLDETPNVFDLGDHGAIITWSTAEKAYDEDASRVEMQNSLDLHGVFFDKKTGTIGEIQKITKHTKDKEDAGDLDFSDFSSDVVANVSYNKDKMVVYYEKKEFAASGADELLGDVLFPQVTVMAARTYDFATAKWNDNYSAEELAEIEAAYTKERADAYNTCFYGQRFFDFLPPVVLDEQLDGDGYWTEVPTYTELDEEASLKMQIVDTDAMSYNDLGVFAYTIDMDGDLNTNNDRNIYMQIYDFVSDTFTHPIVVTSDNVEDRNIKFVRVSSDSTYLTWLRGSEIVALDMSNIVGDYDKLLVKGTTKAGGNFYYIKKERPASEADEVLYIPPMKMVDGSVENTDSDGCIISSFDVKTSDKYVYYIWTQLDSALKDGVEEGSYEATKPENSLAEHQMYTARYDITTGVVTKPVQITSEKAVNYSDVAFEVNDDKMIGLVYKAPSRLITLEEYNAMIRENNAAGDNGASVSANEIMEELSESEFVPYTVTDFENAAPYAFELDPKSVVKIKDASYENAVAGEGATVSFSILNDGVDTITGMKLKAVDAAGKGVLVNNVETVEEDVTVVDSEVVEEIALENIYGGYTYEGLCQVEIPADAKETSVTIQILDKDGKEVAKETVTKELSGLLELTDVDVAATDTRNEYAVSGKITNVGTAAVDAGKIEIGTQKAEAMTKKTTVDHPQLAVGDEFTFETVVTIDPSKDSTVEEEDNYLEEKTVVYVKASEIVATDEIVRSAEPEEMSKIKAISKLKITKDGGSSLKLKIGEEALVQPEVVSSLIDEKLGITGKEGIQYKYFVADENILSVDEYGVAKAEKAGTTKITVCAYPNDRVFMAENNAEATNNVLGTNVDSYYEVPEAAVFKQEFQIDVIDPNAPTTQQPITQKPAVKVGDVVSESGAQFVVTSADAVQFKAVDNKKRTKVTIPQTIKIDGKTYKVTSIAPKAFASNTKLKSVTIGSNVTKIGSKAFEKCKSLKKITIKSKVLKSIGKSAFKGINKKAVFKLSGSRKQKNKIKKLFKKSVGYQKTMKIR